MKKVRIEQKLNVASQRALSASPKGHSRMTIVAEIETDDERLLECIEKATFHMVLPDVYWDAQALPNRIQRNNCNVNNEQILMAYHIPNITVQEVN